MATRTKKETTMTQNRELNEKWQAWSKRTAQAEELPCGSDAQNRAYEDADRLWAEYEASKCIDCGATDTKYLFGLWWCDEHFPKSQAAQDSVWCLLVFQPKMRQVLQAQKDGVEAVKARVLAELKGDKGWHTGKP
jgi:hypothetical protein